MVCLDSFEKVDSMNAKKQGSSKPTVEPAVDYLVLENGKPKVDAVSLILPKVHPHPEKYNQKLFLKSRDPMPGEVWVPSLPLHLHLHLIANLCKTVQKSTSALIGTLIFKTMQKSAKKIGHPSTNFPVQKSELVQTAESGRPKK